MSVRTVEVMAWHPEIPGWNIPGAGVLDWQTDAPCTQTDPEIFFPEKGGSIRDAKQVCRGCDVRAECLAYALANDERFGIWGCLSERERHRLARQEPASTMQRSEAALHAAPRPCPKGHLRTPDNVYPNGSCRKCAIAREREAKQRRDAARADAMRRYMEQETAA
jgi:predicted Fe-S protein YdhL (DUF1289 family)